VPEPVYACPLCRDTGSVDHPETNSASRCVCSIRKQIAGIFRRNGINPDDIKRIRDFKQTLPAHVEAVQAIRKFVTTFRSSDRQPSGLMFCGQPGSGKTHLALATAKILVEQPRPVQLAYFPYIKTMQALKGLALDVRENSRLRETFIDAELLVIEDLYKDRAKTKTELPEADVRQLFPIIDERYTLKRPLIVTTELTPKDLWAIDTGLARRLLELCRGGIFEFSGQEYFYRE